MGLREDLLAKQDLPVQPVAIPQWDCRIFVRTLTAAEQDTFDRSLLDDDGRVTNTKNMRARYVVLTACDENGKRLFTDQDVAALSEKNAKAIAVIYDAAAKLNTDGAEAEGNSADVGSAASPSD